MTSAKLASILDALRSGHEYAAAASMNSDPAERAELENFMLNRIQAAAENAGFEIVREQRRKAT